MKGELAIELTILNKLIGNDPRYIALKFMEIIQKMAPLLAHYTTPRQSPPSAALKNSSTGLRTKIIGSNNQRISFFDAKYRGGI